MKALCITGPDNNTLERIAHSFYEAGMSVPASLQREAQIDFTSWHVKVAGSFREQQNIGRLWENLASDLVLANIDSEVWGWYEEKSVWALDFWADLEPNIYFLLVCNRPEEEIDNLLSNLSGEPLDTERCIIEWYQRHRAMLDFYLKYPGRCLLIDGQDALQHLSQQLLLVHDHWQLPLSEKTLEGLSDSAVHESLDSQEKGLVSFVAREAIKNSKLDVAGFYLELRTAQYPITNLAHSADVTSELFDWLNDKVTSTTLNKILAEYKIVQQQAIRAAELPLLESRTEQIEEQKETAEQELNEQLEKIENQTRAANIQLIEARNSSEGLLKKLHESQKAHEQYFSEVQTLTAEKFKLVSVNRQLEFQNEQLQQLNKGWFGRIRASKVITPLLEFQDISLQHEQVNPDYEHLWLTLHKPTFNGVTQEQWSFRISSAAVTTDSFGKQPKLEFPKQKTQLLEHWFAESNCHFGAKLEMRFALPDAMDLSVWKQLHANDQQLISALVNELPAMLSHLQGKGTKITRSWDDWKNLVADIQRIKQAKVPS